MMMTCRLLCALLVLALCCFPSVCATEIEPVEDPSKKTTTTTTATPTTMSLANGKAANPVSRAPEEEPKVEGELGKPGSDTAVEQTNNAPGTPGSTGSGQQSIEVSNALQRKGTDSKTGPQGGTNQSADQTVQNDDDSAQTTTTTTTTKAPTTTTTSAPEAPSTTTTEAPAVSTTRTPSRLSEIDGSLSSSAWVCAPLVLAASALAYTAVG
ncbi:putative mucin TcMUCII [Trypanosoma cruzi]|nr:putative mucin TcMUCII [Trypanosoma cruzi]